jgi:genome maintenance exonuclease 1
MFNYVKLPELDFELKSETTNKGRTYVTPKGDVYPSVTTVLSPYSKEAILSWRKRVGEEVANKISQPASGRGTRIHTLCEQYIDNKVPAFKSPFDQELFNKFKPTLHRINNVYAQELRMYSDHLRIAGTVDCVAEFDGVLSVIDFKTAKRLKNKEDIENYFMQCSAYAIMFEEQFKIPVAQTVVAIAVDDEEPQVFVERRNTHVKRLMYFRDLYERKSGLVVASAV